MIGNVLVSIALQTVGLIGINVFYFGMLSDFSPSRWVCWAYIHLTYVLIIASIYSVKAVKNGHVYAYPKIITATIYYVVSLIVGVVLILINFSSVVVPIITFLILTGIYLKMYLVLMGTESSSIANEKRDRMNMHFIKKVSERLSALRDEVADFKTKKVIDKAYDAVRGAIVTSTSEVAMIENEIEESIDALESAIQGGSTTEIESCVRKIVACVRKRDAEIRLSC